MKTDSSDGLATTETEVMVLRSALWTYRKALARRVDPDFVPKEGHVDRTKATISTIDSMIARFPKELGTMRGGPDTASHEAPSYEPPQAEAIVTRRERYA